MPQPTVTELFRNPRALSSALAALGTLLSRALGFLNSLVTLVLVSNYYLVYFLIIFETCNILFKAHCHIATESLLQGYITAVRQ